MSSEHPGRGLIVQEWIERTGGAERVLDEMVRTFPEADLWCLWNDAPARYPHSVVVESRMARSPLRGRKALGLPLMPATWRRMNTASSHYDWMLVSSYVFAHHARLPGQPEVPRFVYVHTPARYLWEPRLDSRGPRGAVRAAAVPLKAIDRRRASEGGQEFAANSRFIQQRVRRAWHVESRLIYPPVDTTRLQSVPDWAAVLDEADARILASLPESFILGASRFVPYKRLDAAIAAGSASDLPVVIAGSGPEEGRLRTAAQAAGVPVRFVIEPSDALLAALLQRALVYVFPPVEDFGIMPVEAMAVGTPVLVNAVGGASESVVHGETGIHVRSFDDAREVASAVAQALVIRPEGAGARAQDFSSERFARELRAWVTSRHEA